MTCRPVFWGLLAGVMVGASATALATWLWPGVRFNPRPVAPVRHFVTVRELVAPTPPRHWGRRDFNGRTVYIVPLAEEA